MVEINDMHGKLREELAYNDHGALLSSTQYRYKTDDPEAENMHLNNWAEVVEQDGSTSQRLIGYDVDIWQEMMEEKNRTIGAGVAVNIDAFVIPAFFIPIPVTIVRPRPIFQQESTKLKTAVTTKFIKRFGILDKVVAMNNGSTLETQNLLFDSETGNVLLTRTENEFDDAMYQFTYPAHWAYDGMGPAYQTINAVATTSSAGISGGVIPAGLENYFYPGG